jgi:hypothetical protein
MIFIKFKVHESSLRYNSSDFVLANGYLVAELHHLLQNVLLFVFFHEGLVVSLGFLEVAKIVKLLEEVQHLFESERNDFFRVVLLGKVLGIVLQKD